VEDRLRAATGWRRRSQDRLQSIAMVVVVAIGIRSTAWRELLGLPVADVVTDYIAYIYILCARP
jgi:flagellar motor switch protein FliM